MRIAFVSQPWETVNPGDLTGSVSVITYELARLLARSCDVVVYAPWDRRRPRVERVDGVAYRRVRVALDYWLQRAVARAWRSTKTTRPVFASALYYLGYIAQVALDLRGQRCDVVHVHNFSQFLPLLHAANPNARLVLHMHCTWLSDLDRRVVADRLQRASLVVGCSEYVTERVRRAHPAAEPRCRTVHNGVDPRRFVPVEDRPGAGANRRPRLLYVGRLSPEKGVHVLLEAFARVARRHPTVELQIVGPLSVAPRAFFVGDSDDEPVRALDTFYRRDYWQALQEGVPSDLRERVVFVGKTSHADLPRRYQEADVCVVPSVCHEAFGVPCLEAMATRLPVVATRSGGIVEVVEDGETGLLVERGDPVGLAEAIERLLVDERLGRSLGFAGRRRVLAQFAWERIVERWLAAYRDALTAEPCARPVG